MRTKLVLLLFLSASAAAPAQAGSFAQDVSGATGPVILVAAVLPALSGSHSGLARAARRSDGQLVALAVTALIKDTVHEWRPDQSDRKSFPSGHTSAAFPAAGSLAAEHPEQKWLYLGLAAVVGWSRVELDKHYWRDVAAGAALGYASGRWSSHSSEGILIGQVFRW